MNDGKCDLCGETLIVAHSTKYSPEQMRSALRAGFRNKRASRQMFEKLEVLMLKITVEPEQLFPFDDSQRRVKWTFR